MAPPRPQVAPKGKSDRKAPAQKARVENAARDVADRREKALRELEKH